MNDVELASVMYRRFHDYYENSFSLLQNEFLKFRSVTSFYIRLKKCLNGLFYRTEKRSNIE